MSGIYSMNKPHNETVQLYQLNSTARETVKKELSKMKTDFLDIPLIIGGKEIRTGQTRPCQLPHNHQHIIGQYHIASEKEVKMAIEAALEAKKTWAAMPFEHKASIFLKAAELLSTTWRYKMNAATMLTQSKSVHQAEIDVVCELIDFFKFNVYFMEQIIKEQPLSTRDTWNRVEYTPLDGFVYAVSPFNFTSIGGNLASAPALAGNVVLWKPATTAVYSNYLIMKLLEAAGLPKGVINFIPGQSADITDVILKDENFAGFHYTGSTNVFSKVWLQIAQNLQTYHSYPRIVGETGGKNFIFAHKSVDVQTLTTALVRGAFEYQGQKCSAASRAYIPREIWPELKEKLIEMTSTITYGDVNDFSHFMNAVIDEKSFDKITRYIEDAKNDEQAEIICGGHSDKTVGYFIEPTIILSKSPNYVTMIDEIFGPVLTIYVYDDFDETLEICKNSSKYALTGAIFAKSRDVICYMEKKLKTAAGNLYINDKPTGAVVGQQPFGGTKASGTNDKAGSKQNLLRWINTRVIKENFVPPTDYKYPYME